MTKTIDKAQETTAIPNEERLRQLKNCTLFGMPHATSFFILSVLLCPLLSVCAPADTDDAIQTLLPFDAIPAITEPQFVAASEAKLKPDAPVIGVTFNGESHAYSLYLLNGHEIVNDVVGGLNIATTW